VAGARKQGVVTVTSAAAGLYLIEIATGRIWSNRRLAFVAVSASDPGDLVFLDNVEEVRRNLRDFLARRHDWTMATPDRLESEIINAQAGADAQLSPTMRRFVTQFLKARVWRFDHVVLPPDHWRVFQAFEEVATLESMQAACKAFVHGELQAFGIALSRLELVSETLRWPTSLRPGQPAGVVRLGLGLLHEADVTKAVLLGLRVVDLRRFRLDVVPAATGENKHQ
jgi:hypothetical protein